VFITAIIILIGFYKILLSFLLLVNKNHEKFNLISSTFSIIGLIGLITSYLHYGFNYKIDKSAVFSQSLTFTFGFFLTIILINGFVLFPKSLTKHSN
jgi:vacuolar-type H+-ATPase subunit I/STV1